MISKKIFLEALKVAHNLDVSSTKDSVVLYSISFQPTKENKIKAFEYTKQNKGKITIEHTDCGAKLVEMCMDSGGSSLTKEEIADIWAMAAKRFINGASGDITVFVDNADEKSVFKRIELPTILANPKIKTINKIDKFKFEV